MTGAYQAAAQAIGLKVVLKSVPAQNYIDFFTDPKLRASVDGFPTVDYGDYADPAALARPRLVLPGGSQNLRQLQRSSRSQRRWSRPAAPPTRTSGRRWWPRPRSWLPSNCRGSPTVQPDTVLLLGKGLTGAISSSAYLFSPWADSLGGTG